MSLDPLDKFKKPPKGPGLFGETKSEPSWFRRAMNAGFKKFKENTSEHTIAAIDLEEINKARAESHEKIRPSGVEPSSAKPKATFSGTSGELTGFKKISRQFLVEEEQRKKLRAQAMSRGAGDIGRYDRGAFGLSIKGRLFALGIVFVFGFMGLKVGKRWLETSNSLMARAISKKIEAFSGKKTAKTPKKSDPRAKMIERDQQLDQDLGE